MVEVFKILAPVIFILYWINYSRKKINNLSILTCLLITSFVSFSSNFSFIYRELYQITQILLILFFVYLSVRISNISNVIRYMLFFMLLIFISFFGNKIDSDSFTQTTNFISILGVIAFFCFVFKSKNNIDTFIDFFGRISFLAAIIGIIEFLVIKTPRIELTFANPNYYSLFLGLGFCLLFINTKQLFFKTKLLIIFSAILLTGSRAGLVFPILQLVWYLYVERKYFKICIMLAILSALYLNLDTNRGGSTQASDAERLLFSKIAVQMALENPYNGVGWGRFPAEFSSYSNNIEVIDVDGIDIDASSQDRRVTHNDLLRILSELGFFAFIVSIIYLVYILLTLLRSRSSYERFLLPSWLGLVVFSLTHNNMNSVVFWIFLLLPVFYKNIKNKDYYD